MPKFIEFWFDPITYENGHRYAALYDRQFDAQYLDYINTQTPYDQFQTDLFIEE